MFLLHATLEELKGTHTHYVFGDGVNCEVVRCNLVVFPTGSPLAGALTVNVHGQVSEISVPLSPDEQAAKDPRSRPEPGELELEEPPLLLPVPLFALGPPEPSAVLGGDWEEDSVFSWSESPRLAGLTEEIESNKGVNQHMLSSGDHAMSPPKCTCQDPSEMNNFRAFTAS